jgi:hypothetical protein
MWSEGKTARRAMRAGVCCKCGRREGFPASNDYRDDPLGAIPVCDIQKPPLRRAL